MGAACELVAGKVPASHEDLGEGHFAPGVAGPMLTSGLGPLWRLLLSTGSWH